MVLKLIEDLCKLNFKHLKQIAKKFDIYGKDKDELIKKIYIRYCDIKKYVSYTYIKQLGHEGKDGRTFLALSDKKEEVAIKIFRKNKKGLEIEREAELQKIASNYGISPKIKEYNCDGKYIVMEKLDHNLYDFFCKQKGQLTIKQQKAIIGLFKKLDNCKIFHGDPNPLNFMSRGNKWYVIDFGFAEPINDKTIKKYGINPNIKYMTMGLKIKLQTIFKYCKLDYIDKYIAR
jgi:serine/threonine protein kinase